MTKSTDSYKGFKFAIITLVFFLLFFVLKILAGRETISADAYTRYGGFIMILVVVSSLIGFVFSMRGLKDPKSLKKNIGILVNSILMVLFVVTTIVNIIDFSNAKI